MILTGFRNHWAEKNNKSVRKKDIYRDDKLGWRNAQIAQSAFWGSLSLLFYLQLLKMCFLLSSGCIYWWESWERIWNCGCESSPGLCPWVGRSRGSSRAQTCCVWAFCATEGQEGWPWGQTAALGTGQWHWQSCICGGTGCLAATRTGIPAVLALHREKREAMKLKTGTGDPGWGRDSPKGRAEAVTSITALQSSARYTTAAHSFVFSRLITGILQQFLLIHANCLFPSKFRGKRGEAGNLIQQCHKQHSTDPVLCERQAGGQGKGPPDHGAIGDISCTNLPLSSGESCRVQGGKKIRHERTGAYSWHSQCCTIFLPQVQTKVWNFSEPHISCDKYKATIKYLAASLSSDWT